MHIALKRISEPATAAVIVYAATLVVSFSNSEGNIGPGTILMAVAVVTTLLVWTERTRSAAPSFLVAALALVAALFQLYPPRVASLVIVPMDLIAFWLALKAGMARRRSR